LCFREREAASIDEFHGTPPSSQGAQALWAWAGSASASAARRGCPLQTHQHHMRRVGRRSSSVAKSCSCSLQLYSLAFPFFLHPSLNQNRRQSWPASTGCLFPWEDVRTYADLFRLTQGKKEIGAFEITRRRSSPARQTRSGMVPVSTAQPPSSRNSTRRRMMISRYGWCSTRKYRGSTLLHHLTPTCHGYQGTIPIAPRGREDNQHVMLVLELKINGRREIIKHGQFRTVVLFTCLQKL
jgi:hypothetical protein